MNRPKIWSALFAVVGALSVLSGCVSSNSSSSSSDSGSGGGSSDTLKIGVVMAMSGFMGAFDGPTYEAMKIQADKINAAGGIGGRQIEFDLYDTQSDLTKYAPGAQQVIADGAEILLVTCDYDTAAPAAVVADQAGILNLSCNSDTLYGPPGGLNLGFSYGSGSPGEASAVAEFAYEKGWRNAAVVYDTTIKYTTNTCDIMAKRFTQLGGTVAFTGTYAQGDSPTEMVSKLAAQGKPDVVFHCGYNPGGAQVVKDLRDGGIDSPIVSGNSMDGDYWTSSIPNLSDYYVFTQVSSKGDDPNPEVNAFVDEFTAKTGEAPTTSTFIIGASEIQAIEAAYNAAQSFDGKAMATAMEAFDNEPLLIGPTTFRAGLHISVDRPAAVMQITNGKMAFLEQRSAQEVVMPG